MELNGKTILITGASRGLGLALAKQLAQTGARIAGVARPSGDLDRLHNDLKKHGDQHLTIPVDVTRTDEVTKMVSQVEYQLGPIEILINSAGLGRYNPLEMLTPGEIQQMLDVNLLGTILVTQAVYQRLRPRSRGTIINILSTAGREPKARETVYCASKWGVMGFTKSLALEARKYRIRVTAFCPGGMNTPFWHHESEENRPSQKRLLPPEVVAQSIHQLLLLPENVEIPEIAIRPVV